MPKQCVFCKIIQKNIPASIVHEDDSVICFLPLDMEVYGHTLIVPKEHFKDIYEIPEGTLAELIISTQKLAQNYRRKINSTGINILHASGQSAQQSIFHFHIHLIPRFDNDKIDAWPNFPKTEISHQDILKLLI